MFHVAHTNRVDANRLQERLKALDGEVSEDDDNDEEESEEEDDDDVE